MPAAKKSSQNKGPANFKKAPIAKKYIHRVAMKASNMVPSQIITTKNEKTGKVRITAKAVRVPLCGRAATPKIKGGKVRCTVKKSMKPDIRRVRKL
jgi:hypothetical protein